MENRINYLGLSAILVFLISFGCEKDINEISLAESKETMSAAESPSSLSKTGVRLPDFSGGVRKYAVSFSIGSKIFMGFGFNNEGPVKDLWVWNYEVGATEMGMSKNDEWTKLPVFPGSFYKPGTTEAIPMGFAVNGKGYILRGAFWDNGNLVNEFWEFEPETNTWTRKADPPFTMARHAATGFSIGTKLYIGTGESYEGQWKLYNDFWEWDQITDKWTKKADFPGEARAHATGFSIGNKGYLGLGGEIGMGGGPVYQDFWEYDQATDNWNRKADFNGIQVIGAIGFSLGNRGYVASGWDPVINSSATQEIWEWNQATDSWTKVGIFAGVQRTGAVGGSLGNRGYLLTGQNLSEDWESNPILNDFWLIDLSE